MDNLEDDEFLQTYFSYGLILKGDYEDIKKLKKFIIDELHNSKVIFSKMDLKDLYISESKN